MTAAKFIFRSLWKVKYYTLATFGLFALSRVFIYLDNYCIAALFGYVGTHPEQAFSSAALSWLAVYAALHFGSNIADGVRTFFEYRMDIRLKKNLLVSLFRQTHKHSPAYFAAEMSGRHRKLMKASAPALFWQPFGMHMASMKILKPSFGWLKPRSGFSSTMVR